MRSKAQEDRQSAPPDRRSKPTQNSASVPSKPQLREAYLGSRTPGSCLAVRIPPAEGFVAQALLECEAHPYPVASWQSDEIVGRSTEEILEVPGRYALHVTIIYTSATPVRVALSFRLASGSSTTQMLELTGKLGEVQRAIAFVNIQQHPDSNPGSASTP
jgi:hypothetical protein